jgi:HSP20 family molecular chaperone IbpA
MKKTIFIFLLISSNLGFAQNKAPFQKQLSQDEQFEKQIEEVMKAREEMFNSLMDDSSFGDIEKRMLEMMKRFSGPNLGLGQLEGPVVGEYDWTETDTHKILKIKVKQIKDRPLDIKIEKGMINIKGDVESTEGTGKNKIIRRVNFQRGFSIPSEVDQNTPEFESSEGEILIKFKRLTPAKKSEVKKSIPDRTPVLPGKDELSI